MLEDIALGGAGFAVLMNITGVAIPIWNIWNAREHLGLLDLMEQYPSDPQYSIAGIFELLAIFAMTLVCLLLAFSKKDNKSIRVVVVLLSASAGSLTILGTNVSWKCMESPCNTVGSRGAGIYLCIASGVLSLGVAVMICIPLMHGLIS